LVINIQSIHDARSEKHQVELCLFSNEYLSVNPKCKIKYKYCIIKITFILNIFQCSKYLMKYKDN